MSRSFVRVWLIRWMYFITLAHLGSGVLLAWFANSSWLEGYHQSVLWRFNDLSIQAHQLHTWWLSLFGATLQNIGIFMGILTYLASIHRSAFIWLWMVIGLILWAPQDMLISLQIDLWQHVWVDAFVLLIMLPPLIILWWIDRSPGIPRNT